MTSTPSLQTKEVAPNLPAQQTLPMTVEGVVLKEPKFQSITLDAFTPKKENSLAKTAVIGLIALVLLPFLAIYDLIRYGQHEYNKKFNPQSYQQIENSQQETQAVAAKVETAVGANQEITSDNLNGKAEEQMQADVKAILKEYRRLQGGRFGHLFDSNQALEAEQQILNGQNRLGNTLLAYLDRNVPSASEYKAYLDSLKEYTRFLFKKEAKDTLYIASKTQRTSPPPFLGEVAYREFAYRFGPQIKASFLKTVESDFKKSISAVGFNQATQQVMQNLQIGVEQRLITVDDAKQVAHQVANGVYAKTLAEKGPQKADEATKQFLAKGVETEILTEKGAEESYQKVQFSPQELAHLVVAEVAQYKKENPETEAAVLDGRIVEAAQELKQQQKLQPKDEAIFLNSAKDQLNAIEAKLNEEAEAALKAKQEAEAAELQKAQEEAQALEAQKAQEEREALESAQKAAELEKAVAERQNLFDVLKNFLAQISEKQEELVRRYGIYETQATDKRELIQAIQQILQMKVKVGKNKKEMTVLQAYEYRTKKIVEINTSKETPDRQMEQTAQFDKDFGPEAVELITRVQNLEQAVHEITKTMKETLQSIDTLDREIGGDLNTYKKLSRPEKKKLDLEQRGEIAKLEKTVFSKQETLDTRYRKLHNLGPFAELPSTKEPAAQVNIDDYLSKLVKKTEEQPPLSWTQWFWNNTVGLVF